jgi:hypothetical protein
MSLRDDIKKSMKNGVREGLEDCNGERRHRAERAPGMHGKKMVFYVIPLLMVLMGCAGTAPETGSDSFFVVPSIPSGSSNGMDLDMAIRDAASQMGKNLPAGTEIAIVSVASSSAQLSEYVISRLEAALVGGRKLVVVDRANLDKIREEQGFQLSGEVDDNSAKSIGKLLGAGAIVTGAFTDLGDVYSLTLKAINMETATIAVSYPADIARSARIETMLASGGGGAGTGARAAQRGRSPAAIPAEPIPAGPIPAEPIPARPIPAEPIPARPIPARPADGTYTFNPRVQAFQGARSVSVYLDRIVVRRGYMTIYIFNTPEGDGIGYGSRLVGSWKTATLNDMDNNRFAKMVEVVAKGPPYGDACEYNLSFQNVSGTRLTLASTDRPPIEFYEIVLEQPDD